MAHVREKRKFCREKAYGSWFKSRLACSQCNLFFWFPIGSSTIHRTWIPALVWNKSFEIKTKSRRYWHWFYLVELKIDLDVFMMWRAFILGAKLSLRNQIQSNPGSSILRGLLWKFDINRHKTWTRQGKSIKSCYGYYVFLKRSPPTLYTHKGPTISTCAASNSLQIVYSDVH